MCVQMQFTDYSCIFPCEEYDDCYSISIDLTSNKYEIIASLPFLKHYLGAIISKYLCSKTVFVSVQIHIYFARLNKYLCIYEDRYFWDRRYLDMIVHMQNLIKTLISYWIYWCDTTINVLPLLWSLQSAHIVCALLFREIIQHSIVIFKSLPTHNLGSQKKMIKI